jgi:hypothetical protein
MDVLDMYELFAGVAVLEHIEEMLMLLLDTSI